MLRSDAEYQQSCPKCGSETYLKKSEKHMGWYCVKCGYLKFVRQPWQHFIMPIGKYKGKNLEEIKKVDKKYLYWCIENMKNGSIRKQCQEATNCNEPEKI